VYELLGICLTLSALLVLNALASALAELIWRALASRISLRRASARARLLFTLRMFPSALATAVVFAVVIPSYLLTEPKNTGESVGAKLLLLATVSAAGVFLALWRIGRTWLATRRLAHDWMRNAVRVEVEGARMPAYSIRHRFPVIAVIGILRPRLFIAEQIFDALTSEEMSAALSHERGHVCARDNLKRALLQAGQDALLLAPLGRSLRREWQRESELAADEFAAEGAPFAAVNLASAIVKISRLVPTGARPSLPAGAHLLGEQEEGLSRRVRNLLRLASSKGRARTVHHPSGRLPWTTLLCLGLFVATGSLIITHPAILKATHFAIERIVESLR
jgi:Zn-dependent protease with chaperone function